MVELKASSFQDLMLMVMPQNLKQFFKIEFSFKKHRKHLKLMKQIFWLDSQFC